MSDWLVKTFLPMLGPSIASWVIGCGAAFSLIQSVKSARRDCKVKRLPHSVLRLLSFVLAGLFTFLAARTFFNMDPETAALHGVLVGVFYPVVLTIVMVWAKQKRPALYDRLRVARRRTNDKHDDSGTFFF